ncbi:ATP-binding protein [Streptomyces sp. NPDC005574]|uniref:ATP-binding protein n=1 Tax=Streptomyces sp. NPDC005574 TaxID=3156891 RepID=UPI0033A7FE76
MNHENTDLVLATRQFTVLLSSTRRGARLARLLTERQLADWGQPFDAAAQVVAELAGNAVLHGRVPGRDFRLTLALSGAGTLRIAVTDTRGERLPHVTQGDAPDAESGRGLLLVEAYADRWGVDLGPVPRKTVWAELEVGRERASGVRRHGL